MSDERLPEKNFITILLVILSRLLTMAFCVHFVVLLVVYSCYPYLCIRNYFFKTFEGRLVPPARRL